MLRTHAPFPEVGSYGLKAEDSQLHLVRIIARSGDQAGIAFPLRRGASGNKTVPLAELIDATPLAAADHARLREIEQEMGQLATNGKARRQRRIEADALHSRDVYSRTLADLMKRLPPELRSAA